jgi:hypothetical protein
MDVIGQRPAALDVLQGAGHRVRADSWARSHAGREVREFKTTVGGLLALHDWLVAHGVTQVAMEATASCRVGQRVCRPLRK